MNNPTYPSQRLKN